MSDYLNLIQVISGVLAAGLIFTGIVLCVKKLNPEKHETIPVKTTVISTLLIAAGLLSYSVIVACTNLTVVTEEHYELWTIYLASLGEVVKKFGFIVFIPLVFRLFKPKQHRETPEEEITESAEEA